jgi:crotonobetainyl-CoA:carnitine CoA-transferase CaiB-like acyl-CoA transferase
VAAGNDGQFRRLAAALGRPELADDERFASVARRNDNRELLRPILLERLATRSATEWFQVLSDAGVPCGPINDVRGGVELAEQLGLEPVVLAGGVPTVRNPSSMSTTPASYDLAPPGLDEHGDEIRAWLAAPAGPAVPSA